MSKRMLLSVDRDESRAAVTEDGQLVHLEIEPVDRNTCKGNIYRAIVARVEPSLQSAFVDFGNDKQGFLPVGEIHPKLRGGNQDRRAPIQDLLRAKTEILVQVVRDEIGQKGATLSTFISLPGRYLVLIPESGEKTGVSRKLSDEARDRVRELTETMQIPDGFGLIVRTAGETASKTELAKDLLYLSRQWAHIQEKCAAGKGAALLYAERSLPVRFVRDYFSKDIEEVVIDDDETLNEVGEFLQVLMPRGLSAVTRYQGDVPLFARYGMEGKVEDVFARQVYLPSGGSIVIDQTEAMVAIDVNSGRMKEKDIEETARATNMEAAIEIARQMILRDMGGLIVIDFIDMRDKKYQRDVEQTLKDAFKNDKARTKVSHISEFGLMEMSRQRIKSSVNKGAFDPCSHCSGTGRLRSMDSVGVSVLRRIYELVAQKRVRYVIAMVPPAAARYLLNSRRAELAMVEKQYHLTIEIVAVEGMSGAQVQLEHLEDLPAETGQERVERIRLLRVTQELDLVRNHLVKREETKIQLETASARRGALVDYAEIYKEVRQMAPIEDDAAPSSGGGRKPHRGGHRHAPAPVDTGNARAVVEAEVYEEPEQPKGLLGWIKGLFGMTEPKIESTSRDTTPAAAAPVAALPPAGQNQGAQARENHSHERVPHRRNENQNERAERDGQRAERDGQRGERDGQRGERGAERGERGAERAERDGPRPEREHRGDRQRGPRNEQGRPDNARGEQNRTENQRAEPSRNDTTRDSGGRGDPNRGESPRAETVRATPAVEERDAQAPADAVEAGAAPMSAAERDEQDARRGRRRRRRRGGRNDKDVNALGGDGDGVGEGGSDGESTNDGEGGDESDADDRIEGADFSREDAGTAEGEEPVVAAETADNDAEVSADADAAPARKRRGRQRKPSEDEQSAAAGAERPQPEHRDHAQPTEAQAATAAVQVLENEGGIVATPAATAEAAVDVHDLMQAEIERLRQEQAPVETEAAAATTADIEPATKPSASKRFVVDLRTGQR